MNVDEAIKLGGDLLDYHGLYDWAFVVETRPLGRCGLCSFSTHQICISEVHVIDDPDEEIQDTILHEIAHALVGPGHGHDNLWKAKCIEIGAKPERLFRTKLVRRFIAVCPTCRREFQKQRQPKYAMYCTLCYSKGLPAKLTYNLNPNYMAATLRRAHVKHNDKGVSAPVQGLLIQLQSADKRQAKHIRSQLRTLGHYGGLK